MICLLFFKVYSEWKEDNIVHKQKENKERIIKNFEENKNIFDILVKNIYSREEEIQIVFSDKNIKFIADGKEEELDNEYYNLLNRIYKILKCERIRLHKDSSENKILQIYLIDEGVYSDSIIFGKDKEESMDEFSPGWYYKTLWST